MSQRYFAPISLENLKQKIKKASTETRKNFRSNEEEEYLDPQTLLDHLGKDIKVQFDLENFYGFGDRSHKGLHGYHTLDNGLAFCGMTSGGDWEHPVFFIVYWDGKKLRGYVPTEGNPWNTDTKQAYGNDEEADLKNARKRWPDCPEDLDGWFDFDWKAIEKDIRERIRPVSEKGPSKSNPKPLTMQQRIEALTFYNPNDEAGELFAKACSFCYALTGLGEDEKAEVVYSWAKEMAEESEKWSKEELGDEWDWEKTKGHWGY